MYLDFKGGYTQLSFKGRTLQMTLGMILWDAVILGHSLPLEEEGLKPSS